MNTDPMKSITGYLDVVGKICKNKIYSRQDQYQRENVCHMTKSVYICACQQAIQ